MCSTEYNQSYSNSKHQFNVIRSSPSSYKWSCSKGINIEIRDTFYLRNKCPAYGQFRQQLPSLTDLGFVIRTVFYTTNTPGLHSLLIHSTTSLHTIFTWIQFNIIFYAYVSQVPLSFEVPNQVYYALFIYFMLSWLIFLHPINIRTGPLGKDLLEQSVIHKQGNVHFLIQIIILCTFEPLCLIGWNIWLRMSESEMLLIVRSFCSQTRCHSWDSN